MWRAFVFAGNRQLFRELNLLGQARAIIKTVYLEDAELMRCPHRLTRWSIATQKLHIRVRRSGYPVPVSLEGLPQYYFLPAAKRQLQAWLDSARVAIGVRRAAVRESYAKARHCNLQALRRKQKELNGMLDKYTIQSALRKSQPLQRMWAISGTVYLGVTIMVPRERQARVLELLNSCPYTEDVVHLEGCGPT